MPKVEVSPQFKEYIKFINSLRCPMCKAQLDGEAHPKRSILECCFAPYEYKCEYRNWSKEPFSETANVYLNDIQYEAKSSLCDNGSYITKIGTYDLTFNEKTRHLSYKFYMQVNGKIPSFFFNKNGYEFNKKIQLFQVFR